MIKELYMDRDKWALKGDSLRAIFSDENQDGARITSVTGPGNRNNAGKVRIVIEGRATEKQIDSVRELGF